MTSFSQLFSAYPAALPITALVLGLMVGSFLNVVIHRLPVMLERRWREQCQELNGKPRSNTERYNLLVPRSHCPQCGHHISALENIPLISFAWLGGKCAGCDKPIPKRYPTVELVTGLLSAIVAWHFGFSLAMLGGLLLTWAVVALTFIDYDHQLLPDDITLPLLWLGLAFNLPGTFAPIGAAVVGAFAGYLSLWIVYQAFKLITGKEGMGYGDFKLFAAFGAWLGWQQLPFIILCSSLLGAVVGLGFIAFRGRDRSLPIPFGPFLCLAGWIALLWGDAITRAYLQFARF